MTHNNKNSETHHQAMEALRRQRDHDAIEQGIAEMEAGEGVSVEEAHRLTRERLLSRKPAKNRLTT